MFETDVYGGIAMTTKRYRTQLANGSSIAAGEIFAERGFDGTTVRDICQRAGANIAAVNYYFGDKQRLYVEAVVQAHRWRMEQFPLPRVVGRTRRRKRSSPISSRRSFVASAAGRTTPGTRSS